MLWFLRRISSCEVRFSLKTINSWELTTVFFGLHLTGRSSYLVLLSNEASTSLLQVKLRSHACSRFRWRFSTSFKYRVRNTAMSYGAWFVHIIGYSRGWSMRPRSNAFSFGFFLWYKWVLRSFQLAWRSYRTKIVEVSSFSYTSSMHRLISSQQH